MPVHKPKPTKAEQVFSRDVSAHFTGKASPFSAFCTSYRGDERAPVMGKSSLFGGYMWREDI